MSRALLGVGRARVDLYHLVVHVLPELRALLRFGELGLEVSADSDLAVHDARLLELAEEVLQLQVGGDRRWLLDLVLFLLRLVLPGAGRLDGLEPVVL